MQFHYLTCPLVKLSLGQLLWFDHRFNGAPGTCTTVLLDCHALLFTGTVLSCNGRAETRVGTSVGTSVGKQISNYLQDTIKWIREL